MPIILPSPETVLSMLRISEVSVLFDVLSLTIERPPTKRTVRNMLAGKSKNPRLSPDVAFKKWEEAHPGAGVDVSGLQGMLANIPENPISKFDRDILMYRAGTFGLKHNGLHYFCDVLEGILGEEKPLLASMQRKPDARHIAENALVRLIAGEAESQKIGCAGNDEKRIAPALAPLRIKAVLYLFAALETDADSILMPQIWEFGNKPIAGFMQSLIRSSGKSADAFAREYLTSKSRDDDEDAVIKKLKRWRAGENTPGWDKILALAKKMPSENDVVRGFACAVIADSVLRCEKDLRLELNLPSEYRRYLEIHRKNAKNNGGAKAPPL